MAAVARIGENIQLPRFTRYEVAGNGIVAAYIHTGSKVGVLVEVGAGKEATVASEDFKQLVRDNTLQITAGNPTVISREQVPADLVAKEKEIAADQVKNKPPQAIAKIVEGKLEKFYQGICLVDQGFVKRNSEVTVKEHMGSIAKQLGDEIIVIRRFARYQVGAKVRQRKRGFSRNLAVFLRSLGSFAAILDGHEGTHRTQKRPDRFNPIPVRQWRTALADFRHNGFLRGTFESGSFAP